MVETHKKTRRHRVVHRRLHHDPAKKQEILDRVDAILQEEPKAQVQSPVAEEKPGTAVLSQTPPVTSQAVLQTTPVTVVNPVEAPAEEAKKEDVPVVSQPSVVESQPSIPSESMGVSSDIQTQVPPQSQQEDLSNKTPTSLSSAAPAVDQTVSGSATSETPGPPWRTEMAQEALESNGPTWKKKIFTIILYVVIIVASIGGGYMLYAKVLRKEPAKTSETTSPAVSESKTGQSKTNPTLVPSPTIKPVDLKMYSIKILNGSGIRGEAAKGEQILESNGFKIASIGNATSSDYIKTVIQVKKDVNDGYLAKLKETISKVYILSGVQEIPVDETADVVVIIGSTKAE